MNKNIQFLSKPTHSHYTSFSTRQKSKKNQYHHPPIKSGVFLQHIYTNKSPIYSPTLQPKLKIGTPGDIYEQEADRLSEQVMMMPDLVCPTCVEQGVVQRQVDDEEEKKRIEEGDQLQGMIQQKYISDSITPFIRRDVDDEEEEKELYDQGLQYKTSGNQAGQVSPGISSRINSLKSGGQPLSHSARAFFEPRFGADFSHVRVHTGSQAADTAKAVNARAFTTGKDIVFGAGQYSPETAAGRTLLGHELVHVVQQGKGLKLCTHTNSVLLQRQLSSFLVRTAFAPVILHFNASAVKYIKFAAAFAMEAYDSMSSYMTTAARSHVRKAIHYAIIAYNHAYHATITLGKYFFGLKIPAYFITLGSSGFSKSLLNTAATLNTFSRFMLKFSKRIISFPTSKDPSIHYVVKDSYNTVNAVDLVCGAIYTIINSFKIKYLSMKEIVKQGLYRPHKVALIKDINTGLVYRVKGISRIDYWHIDIVPLTDMDTEILTKMYNMPLTTTHLRNHVKQKNFKRHFMYSCPEYSYQFSYYFCRRNRIAKKWCQNYFQHLWRPRPVIFIIPLGANKIIIPGSQHGCPHWTSISGKKYSPCEMIKESEPNKYPGHCCIHFIESESPRHVLRIKKAAKILGLKRRRSIIYPLR